MPINIDTFYDRGADSSYRYNCRTIYFLAGVLIQSLNIKYFLDIL